ncbi:hypothetical protein C8R42DRAFT_442951 [Lentinula raphanica]|nr:hypothetical protein C8R42DRAFT_442951 [Lentinula raphanica]
MKKIQDEIDKMKEKDPEGMKQWLDKQTSEIEAILDKDKEKNKSMKDSLETLRQRHAGVNDPEYNQVLKELEETHGHAVKAFQHIHDPVPPQEVVGKAMSNYLESYLLYIKVYRRFQEVEAASRTH